jgi:hypothetical protein
MKNVFYRIWDLSLADKTPQNTLNMPQICGLIDIVK